MKDFNTNIRTTGWFFFGCFLLVIAALAWKMVITGGETARRPFYDEQFISLMEQLIAEGAANREIADLLCISARTVEHHRASIMKKLNLKSLADLVKYAIRKGYTSAHS